METRDNKEGDERHWQRLGEEGRWGEKVRSCEMRDEGEKVMKGLENGR